MVTGAIQYSIIIPVCNEAKILPLTIPSILAATKDDEVQIIYVCNACTDGSAELIRQLGGASVQVVEISSAGKTKAFNVGDGLTITFPRFYVDADILIDINGFKIMAKELASREVDLVAPRLQFDLSRCSPMSSRVSAIWLALPYAREAAFQNVLGLSAEGRSRWNEFPDIIGDDIFVAAMVPEIRRRIVTEVTAITFPPVHLRDWIQARARWMMGETELSHLGIPLPNVPGKFSTILRMLLTRKTAVSTSLFVAVRIAGRALSLLRRHTSSSWEPVRR